MKAEDRLFFKATKKAQDVSEDRLNSWLLPLISIKGSLERRIDKGEQDDKIKELQAKAETLFQDNLTLIVTMKEMYERIRAFEDELREAGITKRTI